MTTDLLLAKGNAQMGYRTTTQESGYLLVKSNLIHSVLNGQYHSVDRIKKDKMGEACSMYRGQERCIQGSGGDNLRRQTSWKT